MLSNLEVPVRKLKVGQTWRRKKKRETTQWNMLLEIVANSLFSEWSRKGACDCRSVDRRIQFFLESWIEHLSTEEQAPTYKYKKKAYWKYSKRVHGRQRGLRNAASQPESQSATKREGLLPSVASLKFNPYSQIYWPSYCAAHKHNQVNASYHINTNIARVGILDFLLLY